MRGFFTKATHLGAEPDPISGAVTPSIVVSSTFLVKPGNPFIYGRFGHPLRDRFERAIQGLTKAKFALAVTSGVAAGSLITHLLAPGDHILACQGMYGGLVHYFESVATKKNGYEVSYIDLKNEEELLAGIKPKTKLLWLESPTNPLLECYDIAKITALAHSKGVKVVFDNTFYSPYLMTPLELGVDFVIESGTKYVGGHSDIIFGFLYTNDEDAFKRIKQLSNLYGACPAPMDCFLALRGLRTLPLRMDRCQETALKLAQALEGHPKIGAVYYPGLKSSPYYEINKKQARGSSGIIAFSLKDKNLEQTVEFCKSFVVFTYAGSLGGVESLICIPAIFTHASCSPEFKKKVGVTDNLVRLSIGMEDYEDLRADLMDSLADL
jgi:cystathionine beta-lyase/cystathionine gamma-synthase